MSVALPSGLLELFHCGLHEDMAHSLGGLLLRTGQHAEIGAKHHAFFASGLAVAHAGATLGRGSTPEARLLNLF